MIAINIRLYHNLFILIFGALLIGASLSCTQSDNPVSVPDAIGDSGSISGIITYESTDSVIGARVEILNDAESFIARSTETDGIGSYYFENLAAGSYDIAVDDRDGNRLAQASITIKPLESATLDIVVTSEKESLSMPKRYDSSPSMTIDQSKAYTATIHLEKGGEMVVELYPKEAPVTVNSFVFLAREGFYDGVTFFRVVNLGPGLIAQTGDPTNTGTGGPGYEFDNEPSALRRHDRPGILSMANAGIRDGRGTNGSQFFITFAPMGFLDGHEQNGSPKNCSKPGTSCHTVFGVITQGFDVLTSINQRDPSTASSPGDVIKTITIHEG